MPKLSHDEAIKGYWDTVKDKYPDMEFNVFENICKAPFEFIKQCIRNDSLPIITIKYLGKIRPFMPKINGILFAYKNKTEENYVKKSEFLKNYKKELQLYDKKNKETQEETD